MQIILVTVLVCYLNNHFHLVKVIFTHSLSYHLCIVIEINLVEDSAIV